MGPPPVAMVPPRSARGGRLGKALRVVTVVPREVVPREMAPDEMAPRDGMLRARERRHVPGFRLAAAQLLEVEFRRVPDASRAVMIVVLLVLTTRVRVTMTRSSPRRSRQSNSTRSLVPS
jgi:hypothetical protein